MLEEEIVETEETEEKSLMDKARELAAKVTDVYYDPVIKETFTFKLYHTSGEFNDHMRRVKEYKDRNVIIADKDGNIMMFTPEEKMVAANLALRIEWKDMSFEHWLELCKINWDLCVRISDEISRKNGIMSQQRLVDMDF